jgi:hypothetical protein
LEISSPVNFKTWRIAKVLAILQLLKALELHGAYTIQWARLTSDQAMSPADWAVAFASFLFLLLPIVAVLGLFRNNQWGFYPLIVFPIVAAVFGTIPIPFVAHFYSSDVVFMSKVIIVVDLVFVGIGVLLFRNARAKMATKQ